MDEQTRGFRSAIFGGFNREDVMHYIEETDEILHRDRRAALSADRGSVRDE